METNAKSKAPGRVGTDESTHFTVQQMLVLILIVWMVFATILPIMTSDPTVEPTPHQTVFADLAPSLLADERINNDG
jgi:hypothetical protein